MFHLKRLKKRACERRGRNSHSRTRRLTHEPLEARVVLSGNAVGNIVADNAAGAASDNVVLVGDSAAPSGASSQNTASLGRFASAEDLKQYLIEDALERWGHLFGKQVSDIIFFDGGVTLNADYSQTNVQVEGVDEPDLVETDGRYLYSLSRHELIVHEIGEDSQPVVVARLAMGDTVRGLFLTGNRLAVVADGDYSRNQTEVTILDVADPTNPLLLERTLVDGTYIDARAIGNKLYLVGRDDFFLPKPLVKGEPNATTYTPRFYETQEEYLGRIGDQILDLVLPSVASFNGNRGTVASGWLVEPTDIYRPQSNEQAQLVNVVVFDVGDTVPGPLDAMVVVDQAATEIHLSDEGLFVLGSQLQQWSGWGLGWRVWPPAGDNDTSILKISLDDESGELVLSAVGNVPGRLLDQFSFDAHDGYLRIATTQGIGIGTNNGLYVLQQNGETLEIVGRIENIALGEQIYSARFLGDQGYLVTFRQVDPLYAIDLADPSAPIIAGEIKIPGFSNYLQSIGDDFLLGLGRDASAETGLYADPQVSLFDVSDLTDPQLAARFTLPVGRDGGLNLFDDHHAVSYFPEHGILTIVAPPGDETPGSALWVFKIDTSASAIENDLAIEHLATIQDAEIAERALRIDDKLVVFSRDATGNVITVRDIANPEQLLGRDEIRSNWLGRIQFREMKELNPAEGDYLFCMEASTTGFLTFDALFERNGQDDATLTLCDWQMNELAVSESDYPWAQARLDWQAKSGERFYVRVSGSASDVDLRIVNAVSIEGDGQDALLRIQGLPWEADVNFDIYWQTDSSRPLTNSRQQVRSRSATWWKDEPVSTVLTRRLSLDLAGVHYDIAMDAPRVVIEGSGRSTLTVGVTNISTSRAERGDIIADLGDGAGTIICAGPVFGTTGDGEDIGFEMSVDGFREITVNGGDVAKLRGTQAEDTFTVRPGMATMETTTTHYVSVPIRDWQVVTPPAQIIRVIDFREVHGYSSADQFDTAKLYDTPGDDRFVAAPEYAKLYGDGYYARAKGFRYNHGYSIAGGDDLAKMKDSREQDLCIVRSDSVRVLDPDRYPEPNKGLIHRYSNRAKLFERIEIRSHGSSSVSPVRQDLAVLRDAVLTTGDLDKTEREDLGVTVLITGIDRFEFRGDAKDNRSHTEPVDLLLAYWPE